MKPYLTLLTVAMAVALPGSASAQNDFPQWRLTEACSPGDDSCPRFEGRARGKISGVWNTLPPDARASCISETEKVEKSYRLLSDCLALEMQTRLRKQQKSREGDEIVQLTPPAKEPPAPEPPAAPAPPAPAPAASTPAAPPPTAATSAPAAEPAPAPEPAAAPEPPAPSTTAPAAETQPAQPQ